MSKRTMWSGIAVAFLVALVLFPFDPAISYIHSRPPDWWVAFATILLAVMTFVLALVTVFQNSINSKFFKPVLTMRMESARPFAEANVTVSRVSTYWFRVEVTNEGNTEARDVQVYMAGIKKKKADNKYASIEDFSPMRLLWSHTREANIPILLPKMPRFCDVFHIGDPLGKHITRELCEDAEQDEAVLALDLESPDLMLHRFFAKGEYHLILRLGASNHPPKEFVFKVNFEGAWFDDEEKMFGQGMGIASR